MTAAAALHWAVHGKRAAQVRYLLVSALALGLDTAVTLSLTFDHTPAYVAAACGYLLGLGVNWALSVRFVFADEHAAGASQRRQGALFAVSGLVGLAATMAIYSTLLMLSFSPLAAKGCAVVVSFILVYLFRRHLVFPLRA